MRRLAYLSAMISPLAALLVLVEPNAASALSPTRYVDILFPEPEPLIETKNVVYGVVPNHSTDPAYRALHGDPMELLLDIYQPPPSDTDRDRALYIWTHGGNFRVGSKTSPGPLGDYVRRGWVGISIDYRLRPELPGNAAVGALVEPASLPAFIDETKDAQHDLQAAIRWARENAETLGIDPTRIAIGGISAGAITSLMVAFNPEDPGASGTPNQPSNVAAAVSHAGTYAPVLLGRFPMPGRREAGAALPYDRPSSAVPAGRGSLERRAPFENRRDAPFLGSLARGDDGSRSDADLLIRLRNDRHERRKDRVPEFLRGFLDAPVPVDVFPLTHGELREEIDGGSTFGRRVVDEALLLAGEPASP